MGRLTVTVGGRSYDVACGDGEEPHLSDLAEYVDKKAGILVGDGARRGDARTSLLTSLVIADELSDALKQIENLDPEAASQTVQKGSEESTALLNSAAERLENIAARIQGS